MTKLKAERITGLSVVVVIHDGSFEAQAWDGDALVASDHDRKEKEALRLVVENVYKQRCGEVMASQHFRCARCSTSGSLTVHHKVHRSMGRRRDTTDNLEALCLKCHDKEHRGFNK